MDFSQLLQALGDAVEVGDAEALADCFTPDGVYEDYFFEMKHARALRQAPEWEPHFKNLM